jgi:hypothetical protein
MDLFGRKAKKLAEGLEAQRNEAVQIAHQQKLLIADLLARCSGYESQVYSLDAHFRSLLSALSRLAEKEQPKPEPELEPARYVPEEEQELDFLLKNNYISTSDYEHMLKQLEFDNATIELDPDYSPRPDLTY